MERGWLGISVQNLTYDHARSLGLASPRGALVVEVVKESPAEKAGIMKGNVIIAYNGVEVADVDVIRNDVAVTKIGQEVKITLRRKGQSMNLSVRIGNLETAAKIVALSVKERLGAVIRPFTAKESEKYGLESPSGVYFFSLGC